MNSTDFKCTEINSHRLTLVVWCDSWRCPGLRLKPTPHKANKKNSVRVNKYLEFAVHPVASGSRCASRLVSQSPDLQQDLNSDMASSWYFSCLIVATLILHMCLCLPTELAETTVVPAIPEEAEDLPSSAAPVVDPSTYGDLNPKSINLNSLILLSEHWIKNLELTWTVEACIMGSINLM
ncbi:hypothetical protein Bpfe_014744 [Biomphalaria pfeifferi]|uniref:Uncharacterized protein n=1 Tax=Biomphalaria pfeifferi TaxID=112525 RepID=A0AAD8BLN8_BIOPF|nr:hypothetical protein Bpfe_014744 [Biomphalaria pfeifferi]